MQGTVYGLAYRGLYLGFCDFFLQQKRRWLSICTEVSSVQITLSKFPLMFSLAHSKRFTLFGSRIIWQYAAPRVVQPRLFRQRRIADRDKGCPLFRNIFCSSSTVVSSFSFISASMSCSTCPATLDGLPDPGCLAIVPVF